MPELSDQHIREQAATRIDCNIFLDAGAGCGKTQALVARYMALITNGLEVPQIVAVTFTNKAAREMKERLRALFQEHALQASTQNNLEEARRWQRRAQQLENAPIDTIHGFCASLLRRYALRAGLDPNFRVLDEAEQSLLLSDVIRRTLLQRLEAENQRQNTQPQQEQGEMPTASFIVAELGFARAQAAISLLIEKREEEGTRLYIPSSKEELLEEWMQRQEEFQQQCLHLLVTSPLWKKNASILKNHSGRDPGDALEACRARLVQYIEQAEDKTKSVSERLFCLEKIIGEGTIKGKRKGWDDEHILATVKKSVGEFKNANGKICERIREILSDNEEARQAAAELTAAIYQEAHYALAAYEEAKKAQSQLDFADLQLRVRDLLLNNEDIRQDCQKRYKHILVDEFQDTNGLQRDILWLVAGSEPASAEPCCLPLPPPEKLFVVGDAKQSIYRFRGADVTVFNKVREQFVQAGENNGYVVLRLETTFRSHKRLVALYNHLFAQACMMGNEPDREPYEAVYAPLIAYRSFGQEAACCDFHMAYFAAPFAAENQEGLAEEQENETASPSNKPSAEERREAEAQMLAQALRSLIGQNIVSESDENGQAYLRPCREGDIAVLFRATSDMAIYERALRQAGLRYHVTAGRGFFARQEIKDLTNLLAALENPQDEIALAGALRSPLFGLSDETLFWLKQGACSLRRGLMKAGTNTHPHQKEFSEEAQHVAFAWKQFRELRSLKNRLPLTALLEEIIARTGYTAAVAGLFDGDQQIGNVRRLLEIAADFEAQGHFSLRDFLAYLRELTTTQERTPQAPVVEEKEDCLKLMTIHAAKGLEWPVVVVPDLTRKSTGDREAMFRYHRRYGLIACPEDPDTGKCQWPILGCLIKALNEAEERAESRRLLYVALTRARDRLVLSCAFDEQISSEDDWFAGLREALNIDLAAGSSSLSEFISIHIIKAPFEDNFLPVSVQPETAPEHAHSPLDLSQIMPRLASQAPTVADWQRFTVTALSHYRRCPAYYYLRYVLGLAEERMLEAGAASATTSLSAFVRGELIHRALELIGRDGLTNSDILPQALQQACAACVLPQEDFQEMLGRLNWYVQQPLYRDHIASAEKLRSEVPLCFSIGQNDANEPQNETAIIEGKIDAVAEKNGQLIVLDYKTGYDTQESPEPEHIFQIGLYCAGLHKMGQSLAGAYLVYLDRQEIVSVDNMHIEKAFNEAQSLIALIRAGEFAGNGSICANCGLRWACENAQVAPL